MRSQRGLAGVYRLCVGALLLLDAWMVVDLAPRWSVTHNEVGHIPAGLACWYDGDFALYGVNPPLPRMAATAALLDSSGLCLSALCAYRDRPNERHEFEVGAAFADTNALDYQAIVCRARLAGAIWLTLGGVILWRWATRLGGPGCGLFALALWTFEPLVTSHSALATPDVPATVMGLAATFAFTRFLDSESLAHALIAGFLLGLALLCKFTLLLLIPAWAIAWVVRIATQTMPPAASNRTRFWRAAILASTAWMTLNTAYGFEGTGTRLGKLGFASDSFRHLSRPLRNSALGLLPCPVPTTYLRGIDLQQCDFEGSFHSYLRGEWRLRGWWYYYIYAFAVKTPLGHLAIYALALLLTLYRRPAFPCVIWLVPLIVIATASLKTGFTDHIRYILPAYPFLMLGAAVSVSAAVRRVRIPGASLLAALVLSSAASVFTTYPHILGYFNELAGGPHEGWRHLADSNVDWGQDTLALGTWLNHYHGTQPIYMAIDSYVDPTLYLPRRYPAPALGLRGLAIVNVGKLTREYRWLMEHPVVARIGSSIIVFEVGTQCASN